VRLHVVIAVHEAAKWHDACLASLRAQTHADWRAAVVVDPGRDGTLDIARRHAADDPRVDVLPAPHRRWQLVNRREGWRHLDPPDDGVIVLLDGDDRWAHDGALATLAEAFADPATWLTYGRHATFSRRGSRAEQSFARGLRRWGRPGRTSSYPPEALQRRAIRSLGWRAGHPLAFRRFLADAVREEDLRDRDGRPLRAATDAALAYPMLEMAGPEHTRHLDDVLYVYNKADARRVAWTAPARQRRALVRIEQRPAYEAWTPPGDGTGTR